VVADEPRCDFLIEWDRLHHGGYVVVIAVGLVDETTAIGQDPDDSGFSAIDDMRVKASAAPPIGHD
jgi:hypothetical protein